MLCHAVLNPILRNVARGQSVSQISSYSDSSGTRSANLANDGSRATQDTVCAWSQRETDPWWAVDLAGPTIVCLVKLTNARDPDKGNVILQAKHSGPVFPQQINLHSFVL